MLSSCDEYLECQFTRNTDDKGFKELKNTLDDGYLSGKDDYPTSIEEALRMM